MDRTGILAKLTRARDDLDAVVDAMASGDELRHSWTKLLAHNVNNHLTSILFIIERFVQPERMSPDRQTAYVNGLRDVAERIQETIRRLMTVSQVDNLVRLSPVALELAVSEAVQRGRDYAELKSILLETSVQVPVPIMVEADRLGLVESLLNLIGNAIKYSPRGTTVEIRVLLAGSNVEVRVKDQGPGISCDEQQKLFKLGSVLSTKPTGGEPQTGIGLAMTHELIRTMGGTTWCESEPGKGSMFGIRLPLAKSGSQSVIARS